MLGRNGTPLFDKYVVRSKDELDQLNKMHNLTGAYMITGDEKHVGIHKLFYWGQKLKGWFTKENKQKDMDYELCHNMICTGWDEEKRRPTLAHAVFKGVKLNATCYFTYKDKDVTYMNVYVPKDRSLKVELSYNAMRTGDLSVKSKRSKFSWTRLFNSFFKKQTPTQKNKKELSTTLADLLLETNLNNSQGKKPKRYFCAQYAFVLTQASILLASLTDQERKNLTAWSRWAGRKTTANIMHQYLSDENSHFGKLYLANSLFRHDAGYITSTRVGAELDKVSELKILQP